MTFVSISTASNSTSRRSMAVRCTWPKSSSGRSEHSALIGGFQLENSQQSMHASTSRNCSIRQRFRRHYLSNARPGEVKLDLEDVTEYISMLSIQHDPGLVVEQFEISRRRVQHLTKAYRDCGEFPILETTELVPLRRLSRRSRSVDARTALARAAGVATIAHVLRSRDDLSNANNRVHQMMDKGMVEVFVNGESPYVF